MQREQDQRNVYLDNWNISNHRHGLRYLTQKNTKNLLNSQNQRIARLNKDYNISKSFDQNLVVSPERKIRINSEQKLSAQLSHGFITGASGMSQVNSQYRSKIVPTRYSSVLQDYRHKSNSARQAMVENILFGKGEN